MLHKKFFTYYREFGQSTNSRIDSLLDFFDMKSRLMFGEITDNFNTEINYSRVDNQMSQYRKDSMDFFEKALLLKKIK